MNITELCNAAQKTVLPKWIGSFFAAYGLDSVGFLRTGADPFTNPVGHTTSTSLEILYDAVAGNEVNPDAVKDALHRLVQIRAVQDMPPAKAVGALYLLKPLLREHVLPGLAQNDPAKAAEADHSRLTAEYLEAESRLDSLALLAFDMYCSNRERVFSARVEEVKRGQSQVLRWAQRRGYSATGAGDPDGEPEK